MSEAKEQERTTGDLITDVTRQYLRDTRSALLRLHKVLLEGERAVYEQAHGRVESSGQMLQLVLHDAQFAWLRSVSELIVRIDEMLDAKEPSAQAEAENILRQTRELLRPSESGEGFERSYDLALQRDPDAIMAHAEVAKVLAAANRGEA